jgi:hypothetical protein
MSGTTTNSNGGSRARRALVSFLAGCLLLFNSTSRIGPVPGNQSPSFFSYQPLPNQPPVSLSVSTIDKFAF